jgi:hypothetical protein
MFASIEPDWKWATSEGNRELDRLLDRQLMFREELEWLEEAEALSLRVRGSREAQLNGKTARFVAAVNRLEFRLHAAQS